MHPTGAMVVLVVDAPTGHTAAAAVTALVSHVWTMHPPLAGWTITETSVDQLAELQHGDPSPNDGLDSAATR